MTAPQPARAELLALVAAARPDIDADVIGGILTDAATRAVPWGRLIVQTALMIAHPDEDARDLRAALADPTKTRRNP